MQKFPELFELIKNIFVKFNDFVCLAKVVFIDLSVPVTVRK